MKTTIYHLTVITVLSLAMVGCSVKEHAAPSGQNEPRVLRLPHGEEIQKRRERFEAWKIAWKAHVEDRLRTAEDPWEVLDVMLEEIEEPLMPFYSDETHAAMEREIQGGDEMTPEETTRLESEINHALETLGISEDYAEEMFDHVRMIVKKLDLDAVFDVEDE
ncbi:MAG: hypothetical protein OXT74_06435 [Candidatus Poribacteria bacterium]|nr:hypothetical protein [Candidatus Poribacteria bacterium]